MHASQPLDLSTARLDDVLNSYLVESVLDPTTEEQYRVVCRLVERWGECANVAELFRRESLFAFRNWLMTDRAPSTVKVKLGILRTLWLHCCDQGWLTVQPPRGRRINPPIPRRLPDAWTPAQFDAILKHVSAAPVCGHWTPEHWRDLLETLWHTGARITALLACRLDALNGEWLTLDADDDKTLVEKRKRLPASLCERLRRSARPDSRLFGFPRSLPTLRRHYRLILLAAGLPAGRRDLLHKVRRTSATIVAAQSGLEAACAHLGHSDSRMTRANYVDPTQMPVNHALTRKATP